MQTKTKTKKATLIRATNNSSTYLPYTHICKHIIDENKIPIQKQNLKGGQGFFLRRLLMMMKQY